MHRSEVSRRSLLAASGAGAAGWLFGRRLLAAPRAAAAIPRRIVFFYNQQGTLRNLWSPSGTETSFALHELHAPWLDPHKNDLLFLGGLDMTSNDIDPTPSANAHFAGTTHSLTGIDRKSGTLPSGASIDQFIAKEINKAAPLTKLGSLELAAAPVNGEWALSFTDAGAAVPFESDPARAYDRIFAGFTAPTDPLAMDKKAQNELVLRWASGEFDALASRFGAQDRQKLAAHAGAIRDLQARLSIGTPSQCTVPTRQSPKTYDEKIEAHLQLVTAALACDLTRVVTLALPEIPGDVVGYTSGMLGTTDLHDLVHKTAENGALKDNTEAVAPIKRYHQKHAQQFARLLELLKAIPESDGQTLLDHTAILWCGQLGSGSHDLHQLPWLIAGKGGGYFRTGRFVQFPRPGNKGPAHNDLFVTLANYMGIPITTFGNPKVCKGPLAGLTA
jgi:hypothetical protein